MAKSFRTDLSLSRSEWEAEFRRLYASLLAEVYLIDPDGLSDWQKAGTSEEVERAWTGTNFTPLRYVSFVHSPLQLTNMIGRGQKARERRWRKWCATHGIPPDL
jgi:hypothetical protein